VFASRCGDETFGAHHDAWYGAVVQIAGVKDWQIGTGLLDPAGTPARHVRTQAGDILLIPKYLAHIVTTPADPGYSVHLAFAICRDTPDRLRAARDLAPSPGKRREAAS
jgi:ribosomal protein L16 Arg81 hydroxylase